MICSTKTSGEGPVLLFVHGFPLSAEMWRAQLDGLDDLRRCVAIDLRGHGASVDPSPEGYSIDLFADDVADTVASLGVEQVDLCALSMGGYVAFAFWRRHRAMVRSLILCDTKAEPDTDEAKAKRLEAAETARTRGVAAIWEQVGPAMFGAHPDPSTVKTADEIALGVPDEVAAQVALAMRDRPDSRPDLATIDVPVAWIHGADDKLMPVDQARISAGAIGSGTFTVIDDAGHLAPMEQPDAVNAAIRLHLERVG